MANPTPLSHTLVCNASRTSINIGFSVFEVWNNQNISLSLIFASMSWLLVTFFSLYCKNKGASVVSNWPSVLVSWWVFSLLLESILISLHSLNLFNSATIVDFASLPFCATICLCVVVTAMRTCKRDQDELNQPLIIREDTGDCSRDRFSSSGWWSQLTFQWLNPVFEKGYKVRLELEHIPSVPQSETAEHSYALLQETLYKQKPEPISLQRVIICCVWKPLVINTVFAGKQFVMTFQKKSYLFSTQYTNTVFDASLTSVHTKSFSIKCCKSSDNSSETNNQEASNYHRFGW